MEKTISALALSILILFTGCSKKDNNTEPNDEQISIQLTTNVTLGKIMTDKDGRTLYFFADDFNGQNSCTSDGCMSVWPIFAVDDLKQSNLGEGLLASDFGIITTSTGQLQTTYKGRPLYYFNKDVNGVRAPEVAGESGGEGFLNGRWYVAKADYTIMLTYAQLIDVDSINYVSGATADAYQKAEGKSLYFTDNKGVALYTWVNDKKGKNNFSTNPPRAIDSTWPIYGEEPIVIPSVLNAALFESIVTDQGTKQITFNGWPLYRFANDNSVMGSNIGITFPNGSVNWPIAQQDMAVAQD